MGGRVGLKGTDGSEVLARARRLGASPESPRRATEALNALGAIKANLDAYTYPREMGEDVARDAGLAPRVIGTIESGGTTSDDTRRAAKDMLDAGVDLMLFAGGDGTARDVYSAVGRRLTVLGIPTGVKMHSAVFAVTPKSAGLAAAHFLGTGNARVMEAEVMDIDERSFRRGSLAAKLYGYLRIPEEGQLIQSVKSGGSQTRKDVSAGMARGLTSSMEDDVLYVVGPGTTTRDILAQMGLEKTLLGVDIMVKGRLVARDVNERQIATAIKGKKAKVVLTVIGGQGYILGRGNQQLSPRIIKQVGKDGIVIVASKEKLASLRGRPLLVDTGDEQVNRMLEGYVRIITGFDEVAMYRVASETVVT